MFKDYVSSRLTLREHPISLLRSELGIVGWADDLRNTPDKAWISDCVSLA